MNSSSSSIDNPSSPIRCEIKIMRANHLEFIPPGDGTVFVRYYPSAGTVKRVCLNSREVPSACDPSWNQSFTLECHSSAANSLEELRLQCIVFELRWRSSSWILRRIVGSRLLGRAEIAWKEVLESDDGLIERWIPITSACRAHSSLKPPGLLVGLRVGALEKLEMVKNRVVRLEKWKQCSCSDGGCNYGDEEIFPIAAALVVA